MKNFEQNLIAFLDKFPTDATSWSQATDEIRDLARIVREYYNEMVLDVPNEDGIEPVNFRIIASPAEWNKKARKFILKYWPELPEKEKIFIDDLLSY